LSYPKQQGEKNPKTQAPNYKKNLKIQYPMTKTFITVVLNPFLNTEVPLIMPGGKAGFGSVVSNFDFESLELI
jgi:hypothetical protein